MKWWRERRRSVYAGERDCVSEREQPLTTMACICTAPNKSSPSNQREIHCLGCSFLVCSWYDILISFAGCSARVLPLNLSKRKRKRNSCPSKTHISILWKANPLLTSLICFHGHSCTTLERCHVFLQVCGFFLMLCLKVTSSGLG